MKLAMIIAINKIMLMKKVHWLDYLQFLRGKNVTKGIWPWKLDV